MYILISLVNLGPKRLPYGGKLERELNQDRKVHSFSSATTPYYADTKAAETVWLVKIR